MGGAIVSYTIHWMDLLIPFTGSCDRPSCMMRAWRDDNLELPQPHYISLLDLYLLLVPLLGSKSYIA